MNKTDCIVNGRYKVGKRIGAGSFGQVYMGTHTSFNPFIGIDVVTQQEVAIKAVH